MGICLVMDVFKTVITIHCGDLFSNGCFVITIHCGDLFSNGCFQEVITIHCGDLFSNGCFQDSNYHSLWGFV